MIDPTAWRRHVVAHAVADTPREACGLIAVDGDGQPMRAYPTRNVSGTPTTAFTVDPDDHHAALVDAEARRWTIGGAYHSHPRGPAIPSPVDLRTLAGDGWIQVIVGLGGAEPEVRIWRIADGAADEVHA